MSTTSSFSNAVVAGLAGAKIVGVRSGTEHRPTGVWVVVVKGRVFARSWSDKPTGWFRAFIGEPRGVVQIPNGPEIRVRAKRVRGERLLDAIDATYPTKYNTPASQKWVRGFTEPERRATTIEFVPG
jgi:hypothetical protein